MWLVHQQPTLILCAVWQQQTAYSIHAAMHVLTDAMLDSVRFVASLCSQVSDAIQLSRRTLAKIQQNLMWAFGYNVISIPLAAGALLPSMGICLTPSISGALMGLSSVMVVGNSLLLQWEMHEEFRKKDQAILAAAAARAAATAATSSASGASVVIDMSNAGADRAGAQATNVKPLGEGVSKAQVLASMAASSGMGDAGTKRAPADRNE